MLMPPNVRKLVLAVHLTISIGWIGAVAAYIAFDIVAAAGGDAQQLRISYLAMEQIARYVIVPLAIASLLTGFVVSLGTKWGLIRHYWVVISLALTAFATLVLLREIRVIGHYADVAGHPATSSEALRELPSTLLHSVGGIVVLLVILVLNVYKPRGLTRYGRRKEEQRARPGA